MSEEEFELKTANEELKLHVEKLSCTLKFFMSKSTIKKDEAIKIVSDFDKASSKEEVMNIYNSLIEKELKK